MLAVLVSMCCTRHSRERRRGERPQSLEPAAFVKNSSKAPQGIPGECACQLAPLLVVIGVFLLLWAAKCGV